MPKASSAASLFADSVLWLGADGSAPNSLVGRIAGDGAQCG